MMQACDMFAELMPDREIIKIYTREWSLCGGNIHCMAPRQPDRLPFAAED